MSERAMCQATFEPCPDRSPSRLAQTHTCGEHLNHGGPHRCPTCGAMWTRRPSAPRGRIVTTTTTPARTPQAQAGETGDNR